MGFNLESPPEIISALELRSGRKDKINILTSVMSDEFWIGVKYALSPYHTFGVKKIPIKQDDSGDGLSFSDFEKLLVALTTRDITGNAAAEAIDGAMMNSTQSQWNNWYRRILIKDLRCGVSEKTLNDVRENAVPTFDCQLAKNVSENPKKMIGRKISDFKLDGVRAIAFVRFNNHTESYSVDIFSRSGLKFENFSLIEKELSEFLMKNHLKYNNLVLDGEITSKTFQNLMTQVNRKYDVNITDAMFNVFDIIPSISEFTSGKCELSQGDRKKIIRDGFNNFDGCKYITGVEYVVIDDVATEDGAAVVEALKRQAKELGFEGIMIKDYDAPYECKKSFNWIKIKPAITLDLTIDDAVVGEGKYAQSLGALVCSGLHEEKMINVNFGSGLTDEMREMLWKIWQEDPSSLKGQILELEADAVTQNKDGTYSLRFPRFVRFRGFVPGEKI